MSVREYVEILWRRKWVIVITFVVLMAVTVVATLLMTPMYRASTTLRVLSVSGGGSADWVVYDTRQLERLINTYAETATSRPALGELSERLGLHWLAPEERPKIQVELVPGTELVKVVAEAPDPMVARDAANTLAEILIAQSQALFLGTGKTAQEILGDQLGGAKVELDQAWLEYETLIGESPGDADRIAAAGRSIELKEETYTTLLEQYERNRVRQAVLANTLSVVEGAVAPRNPAKPRVKLNVALGLMVGLVGGIGLAFLLENLDTALYSVEQIKRAAELPILGRIPVGGRREQVGVFDENSLQGEAFRRLRTNLFTLDHNEGLQSVLVTSAEPGEGKSTVAANLGFSVAQSGRKVVVVDAHLRLPVIHKAYGLTNRVGLSSVLGGKASLEEAIQRDEESGVDVLTSGPLPANPAELVSSPQMSELLEELARRYDLVLLDTPSFLAVTDAAAIASKADRVVLVVGRAQARQGSVRAASQQLLDVGAHPLGVVVNRTRQETYHDYYQRMTMSGTPKSSEQKVSLSGRLGRSRTAGEQPPQQGAPAPSSGNVSRSAFKVGLGGLFTLIVGFASQALVAALFGAGTELDAYLTALVVPAYLQAVLLAGLSFVFVPAFVREEMEGSQDEAWALAGTFFWLTAGILLIVAIGGSLLAEQIIGLTAPGFDPAKADLSAGMLTVMMFGVPMSGLGLLTKGIQNARNRFFWPAVATALGSVGNILVLVLLYRTAGPHALAWGYIASQSVLAAVTVVPVLRHGWKGHVPLSDPRVREMARLMAPFILFGVITRSTSLFERFFASGLPDGNLSYLSFSRRVAKIVIALLGTGIATANFPAMARAYTSHGESGLVRQFNYGMRLTMAVALPALAILSTVAVPLVTVLFERGAFDATATASVARIIPLAVLGGVVFQMVGNLCSRTFYVTKDTHTAPIVAAVTTLLYVVIARALAGAGGYVGLAAALPLYRGAAVAVLLGILIWRLKILRSGSVVRDVLLYGAASLVAFVGSWLAVTLLAAQPALLQLVAGCAVGGSLYLILLWLFDRGTAISVLDLLGVLIVFNKVRMFRATKYA